MRARGLVTIGDLNDPAGCRVGSCAYWWWFTHSSEEAIGTE
jgi:hypothetical protein